MAEEAAAVEQVQETPPAEDTGVVVEVASDTDKPGKPQLTDEEVEKLDTTPADDEISRYAKDAQKRIKSLHIANQEWRRRVVQSSKDLATATSLAEQLYKENQQLKTSNTRSEAALIDQALERTKAQLVSARQKARAAYNSQNTDEIIAANEEVARYVAEADRLQLLKPTAGTKEPEGASGAAEATEEPSIRASQPQPVSQSTQTWLQKNAWFGKPGEEELTGFALGVHNALEKQGITDVSNPQAYWSAIDKRMRETFPQRFQAAEATASRESRPVTVTGATRTNGAAQPERRSPRHITLTESQVRIARSLGLTNEQYATQLVKESAAGKERVQ